MMSKSTKVKMTMSKATKRKTTPVNNDLANARLLVSHRFEEAIEDHEADIKDLRQLKSQISNASPYLIQKFASEARHPLSKFADELMASALSYLNRDIEFVPPYGNDDDVIRLDAFLSFYLTQEALRRSRRE
jgi:hypothetical protein